MTDCTPTKFTTGRNFRTRTKAQILQLCEHLDDQIKRNRQTAREKAEEAARTKHLVLSRNGLSDEELASWKRLFEELGEDGLRTLSKSKNVTYNRRREQGLCVMCEAPSPKATKCPDCREYEKRRAA